MPSLGTEISWEMLRQIVREWAGASADLREVTPLEGGCVNTTVALTLADGSKSVLKITPHRVDRAYADEGAQLELLRAAGVPVPQIYACQCGTLDDPHSFILMEFVEGIDLAAAKASCQPEEFDSIQQHLAELMLKAHAQTATHFMRVCSVETRRFDNWPAFYHEVFDPIWQEVEKSSAFPIKTRKVIGRLHERLDRFLAPCSRPSLLHWDVWSSNVLCRRDGQGRWGVAALLDPNCKFGHAEAEIAYLELFQTITPAFLKAYQQSQRLPSEYHQMRRTIYQLYSLLNHVRLFGQEYVRPVLTAVDKVANLV